MEMETGINLLDIYKMYQFLYVKSRFIALRATLYWYPIIFCSLAVCNQETSLTKHAWVRLLVNGWADHAVFLPSPASPLPMHGLCSMVAVTGFCTCTEPHNNNCSIANWDDINAIFPFVLCYHGDNIQT